MTFAQDAQDNTRVCNIRINKADELANPALRVLHSQAEKLHRYDHTHSVVHVLLCAYILVACGVIVSASSTWLMPVP